MRLTGFGFLDRRLAVFVLVCIVEDSLDRTLALVVVVSAQQSAKLDKI